MTDHLFLKFLYGYFMFDVTHVCVKSDVISGVSDIRMPLKTFMLTVLPFSVMRILCSN